MKNTEPLIFLSYSRTDREACIVLREVLEKAGLSVFRDEDDCRAGDAWVQILEDALRNCTAFIVLIGQDGIRGWVGAEVQVALNRHLTTRNADERLPIFPVLLPGVTVEELPPLLALHQSAMWSSPEPVPEKLLDNLKSKAPVSEQVHQMEGCPFLGLKAFSRDDAHLFFGRSDETLEALACIGSQLQKSPEHISEQGGSKSHSWLQIEGSSGSGKSSFVNAGLLPMIEQGALWARTGYEHWRILGTMLPGLNPLANLAETLEHALVNEADARDGLARLRRLEADEQALSFMIRDAKRPGQAFVLVVDQFEELFTASSKEQRKQFDALLACALQDSECPLYVISTIRADFLDRFEALPRLQSIYNSSCRRYLLPGVSEAGLRDIIELRAKMAGLDVRDVTAVILEDAREEIGALPLVENTLYTLWRNRDGNRLSAEYYRRSGGIAGMLSGQADVLLDKIHSAFSGGRQAALEVMLALTRINDSGANSRQRISYEEALFVAGDGDQGEKVLQLLSGERPQEAGANDPEGAIRLITTESLDGQLNVDLIHETLVRVRSKDELGIAQPYWPTLYEYIDKNRNRKSERLALKLQADLWRQSGAPASFFQLAGWSELYRYRKQRFRPDSTEGRFLRTSYRKAMLTMAVSLLTVSLFTESLVWALQRELPLKSIVTLQKFRLGYKPLPELVTVEGGEFVMGEHDTSFRDTRRGKPFEDYTRFGGPLTKINVSGPLRVGKTEVTYDQYDYYLWQIEHDTTGELTYPPTAEGGRGSRPVVSLTNEEAQSYTAWLGEYQDLDCRLPTEAEWEYAARGGSDDFFWWGYLAEEEDGNYCAGECEHSQSRPVAEYAPNQFGLHDTSGNVSEMTCSAWDDEFSGEEQICAKSDPGGRGYVLRGGNMRTPAIFAASSARSWAKSKHTNSTIGFRVFCRQQSPPPKANNNDNQVSKR